MPFIYSFRRCPYAMRARLAIRSAQLRVELREILLKNKPQTMLDVSAKGTVPVLVLENKPDQSVRVIDESLDIMLWAFNQNDPKELIKASNKENALALIHDNDHVFKTWLDKYKYFDRFKEHEQIFYREKACEFIQRLETKLSNQRYLLGESISIADLAIFPFIRQFAYVDIQWFQQSEYTHLKNWLNDWLDSDLFISIMKKNPPWQAGNDTIFV